MKSIHQTRVQYYIFALLLIILPELGALCGMIKKDLNVTLLQQENFVSDSSKISPLQHFIKTIGLLHTKGFEILTQNKWSPDYGPKYRCNDTIMKESFIWECGTRDSVYSIKIESLLILSTVVRKKGSDVKITCFYFSDMAKLNSNRKKLKCVSAFIVNDRGLKRPNVLIFKATEVFLIETRACAFEPQLEEVKRLLDDR